MAALSALALALIATAYLVAPGAQLWAANASWTIAGVVAALGTGLAWRTAAPRDRAAWGVMFAAAAMWLLGMALWDFYALTSFPTSPSLADLSWLAFAAIATLGVHRLGRSACRSRRLSGLEITPLAAGVCALVVALLWDDVLASSLPRPAALAALAYPIFYVSTALVMLQCVVRGAIDVRQNPGMTMLLVGLLIDALAFTFWAPQLLNGTYVPGAHAIDALWTIAMVLIGIGAWRARPVSSVEDVEQVARRRGGMLPSLVFGLLLATQLHQVLRDAEPVELALTLGVAAVGATQIARARTLRGQQADAVDRLRERERELHEANERLARESRVDPLTGVGNRLRLREDFGDLSARADRYGQGYCLVLCDLDRFKAYNDALGHQAGDDVLRQVAAILAAGMREGDHVYRYGGEELLLVLPEQETDAGHLVAERHRAAVEAAGAPHPANAPAGVVTLSAGVAVAHPGEHPDDVLRRADRALYEAKHLGRNRVAVAPEPLVAVPA